MPYMSIYNGNHLSLSQNRRKPIRTLKCPCVFDTPWPDNPIITKALGMILCFDRQPPTTMAMTEGCAGAWPRTAPFGLLIAIVKTFIPAVKTCGLFRPLWYCSSRRRRAILSPPRAAQRCNLIFLWTRMCAVYDSIRGSARAELAVIFESFITACLDIARCADLLGGAFIVSFYCDFAYNAPY